MGSQVVLRVDPRLESQYEAELAEDAKANQERKKESLEKLKARVQAGTRKKSQSLLERQSLHGTEKVFSDDGTDAEEDRDLDNEDDDEDALKDRKPQVKKTARVMLNRMSVSSLKSSSSSRFGNGPSLDARTSLATQASVFSVVESEAQGADEDHFDEDMLASRTEQDDWIMAYQAFDRYDTNCSGSLDLGELRGALQDIGLMPQTHEEKAALRRTLLHFVMGVEDGNSDTENDVDGDTSNVSSYRSRLDRLGGEGAALLLSVTPKELPGLLGRIRNRLHSYREKANRELFNRYDIFERGELALSTIKTVLQNEGLHPSTPDEHARLKELTSYVRRKEAEEARAQKKTAKAQKAERRICSPSPLRRLAASGDSSDGDSSPPSPKPAKPQLSATSASSRWGDNDGAGSPRRQESPSAETPSKSVKKRTQAAMKATWEAQAATRRELQSKTAGSFSFAAFQIIMDHCRDTVLRRDAEEQRTLAESLGLCAVDASGMGSSKLFLEFRDELKRCHELFLQFDDDDSGYLEIEEIWEALMSLGLMPRYHKDKSTIMKLVAGACEDTERSLDRSKKRFGALQVQMMVQFTRADWKRGSTSKTIAEQEARIAESMNTKRIMFKDFLNLLSKVRAWNQQSLREELTPLFQKQLRKRNNQHAVIGHPDVCRLLEELKMSPSNQQEQQKIKELLDNENEWGFDPPSLDFETFVNFIRRLREWTYGFERARESDLAWKILQFDSRKVSMLRMAFDTLDTQGAGALDVQAIRQVFILLKRAITSDQLRELFAKIDLDGSGNIGFLEFLHLVHELDVGAWGHELQQPAPVKKSPRAATTEQGLDDLPMGATFSELSEMPLQSPRLNRSSTEKFSTPSPKPGTSMKHRFSSPSQLRQLPQSPARELSRSPSSPRETPQRSPTRDMLPSPRGKKGSVTILGEERRDAAEPGRKRGSDLPVTKRGNSFAPGSIDRRKSNLGRLDE